MEFKLLSCIFILLCCSAHARTTHENSRDLKHCSNLSVQGIKDNTKDDGSEGYKGNVEFYGRGLGGRGERGIGAGSRGIRQHPQDKDKNNASDALFSADFLQILLGVSIFQLFFI